MTFVECGAYNERWSYVHMFPEESVQAHSTCAATCLSHTLGHVKLSAPPLV